MSDAMTGKVFAGLAASGAWPYVVAFSREAPTGNTEHDAALQAAVDLVECFAYTIEPAEAFLGGIDALVAHGTITAADRAALLGER